MNYIELEVAVEIAWQVGDTLPNSPRAESRWRIANLVQEFFDTHEMIGTDFTDLDEIVATWLSDQEVTA